MRSFDHSSYAVLVLSIVDPGHEVANHVELGKDASKCGMPMGGSWTSKVHTIIARMPLVLG